MKFKPLDWPFGVNSQASGNLPERGGEGCRMGKEGNGKKRKDGSGVFNGTRLGDEAPICKL